MLKTRVIAASIALGALGAVVSTSASAFTSIGVQLAVPGVSIVAGNTPYYGAPVYTPTHYAAPTYYAAPAAYYPAYNAPRAQWDNNRWDRRDHRHDQRHTNFRGGRGDRDRDGIANRYDRDRDGDGVANRYDRNPNNFNRR
ncbi:MAG: hypothetical protein V4562_01175 [Pseudomonadota bacterium]